MERKEPDWNKAFVKEKVFFTAEKALEALGAISQLHSKSGDEIYKKGLELYPQQTEGVRPVKEDTFYQYLSWAVKDSESRINCMGPWQGYFLSETFQEVEEKEAAQPVPLVQTEATGGQDATVTEPSPKRTEREKLVYPVLAQWLQAQGFQCRDTSSSKKLGKWGNPDITGISITETFGRIDLEITTIEAKAAIGDWEYWIFESVSHRRFANRCYFAFACPEELVAKLPDEMRYYSDLYQIGILAIILKKETYEQLANGELMEPLTSKNAIISEAFAAPHNYVRPFYQKRFLIDGLKVTNLEETFNWGKDR